MWRTPVPCTIGGFRTPPSLLLGLFRTMKGSGAETGRDGVLLGAFRCVLKRRGGCVAQDETDIRCSDRPGGGQVREIDRSTQAGGEKLGLPIQINTQMVS